MVKEKLESISILILVALLVVILLSAFSIIPNPNIIPISAVIGLITAFINGVVALKDYRIKVHEEIRLTKSAEIESDIKLLKLFTEIMDIAHARKENQISEKAVEMLLSPENIGKLGISGSNIEDVLNKSIITLPVGIAAQDSAIAAIWALGKKHELLKPVAIQGLKSLSIFKSVAEKYLEDLENDNDEILATIQSGKLKNN